MLLFIGGGFYSIERTILEELSFISIYWMQYNIILSPTAQKKTRSVLFLRELLQGDSIHHLESWFSECWGFSLHFGDLLEEINLLFILDQIYFLDLNISIDI